MKDEKKASIPIIAMTANAFAEDRQKAISTGMNDHVAKPIDMKVLLPVMAKYIGQNKSADMITQVNHISGFFVKIHGLIQY